MIRYAEFSDYDRRRQEANTAINAMLAGCRLASHVLTLTHGATRPLPRSSLASPASSCSTCGQMSLVRFWRTQSVTSGRWLSRTSKRSMRIMEWVALSCSATRGSSRTRRSKQRTPPICMPSSRPQPASISSPRHARIFQVLRVLRNAVVHRGGTAGDEVVATCAQISVSAQELWTKITSQPHPRYELGEQVRLGFSETIAELAVTKRLAREMNLAMGTVLPRAFWLGRLADDFGALHNVPPQREKRVAVALRLGNFSTAPSSFSREGRGRGRTIKPRTHLSRA